MKSKYIQLSKEELNNKLWYQIIRILFVTAVGVGIVLLISIMSFDNRYFPHIYTDYSKSYYECIPNNSNERFYLSEKYFYPDANNKFETDTDIYIKKQCLGKSTDLQHGADKSNKTSSIETAPEKQTVDLDIKNLEQNYKLTIVKAHKGSWSGFILYCLPPILKLLAIAFIIRSLFLFVITRKFI